jgi:APA family basic amino acid/polyamine antiporter
MILRIKKPNLPRPFKVAGGPYLIPLLGAGSSAVLMYTATTHTLIRLFVWMAIGMLIYVMYGYKNSRLRNLGKQNADIKGGAPAARVATTIS